MNIEEFKALTTLPFSFAVIKDLNFLLNLENECFEEFRRSSEGMIRRSILSDNQLVIIIKNEEGIESGSMTLRLYKKQLRIFSIGIKKSEQGKELGKALINKVIEYGQKLNYRSITLEVDANNNPLICWYESFGFEQKKVLEDYYNPKKHAIKMELLLQDSFKYIVITDFKTDFFENIKNVKHVRSTEFIDSLKYQKAKDIRVFNFCSNYKYQSVGYYVSLLALARNQVAYPSAGLIRDIDNKKVIKSIGEEVNELIQSNLKEELGTEVVISSYFGVSDLSEYQTLVNVMNNLYHAPLINYQFAKHNVWYLKKISVLGLEEVLTNTDHNFREYANNYFSDKRFIRNSFKRYQYEMAILIDREEKLPPSDEKALKQFENAAGILGFYVEFITKKDFERIPEFDALFIRTTTNVNDYTYDFSRYAYAEGLVVLDDPWSILRCANKIYLYEALNNAKVLMPKTWVVNKKNNYKTMVEDFEYPLILKLPDSAFSAGVYKVFNESDCLNKLSEMFMRSELIIAQEYMPTDFDWRIGVLDGKLLYACKYYMAKDHWQIVNWEENEKDYHEGDFEAVDLHDVPTNVLQCALTAAATIGDGLYGVDIKIKNNNTYVIEVNDNPSIEYMVEDAIEGSSLYIKIMMSFYSRLENNMKILRIIS